MSDAHPLRPNASLVDQLFSSVRLIAHEFEESKTVDHDAALKAAAKTELPVTDGAKRILRAMAR